MIYLDLKIVSPLHRTEEMIQALRNQIGLTLSLPGCSQCSITQDSEQKNIILYQETWGSWEELAEYISSEQFSPILELMDESTNTPDLIFRSVLETRGMEYVAKLRM